MSSDIVNRFNRNSVITTVSVSGKGTVFRDKELIQFDVQLPMEKVNRNAVVATYIDGEPCIVVAGHGQGAGVYILHAVTLCEVKSLRSNDDVWCVCINATRTKVFFGTQSGWIC